LYSYDPTTQSPNNGYSEDELTFPGGALIKIYGEIDEDGFYFGELNGSSGFVPGNMIQEIDVNEIDQALTLKEEVSNEQAEVSNEGTEAGNQSVEVAENNPAGDSFDIVFEQQKQKKLTSSAASFSKSLTHLNEAEGSTSNRDMDKSMSMPNINDPPKIDPYQFQAQRMIALFDYDPISSSPNVDCEVELAFTVGEVLHVYGDMDDDGFYAGTLNGKKGLVPSNFIRVATEVEHDTIEKSKAIGESPKLKKKNSILRKSKKIFSRLKGHK